MVKFSNAKINLGLNVLRKRQDGYHDIETVFYPIPLFDVVEVVPSANTTFHNSGLSIPGDDKVDNNLCLTAYQRLASDYSLPNVAIYLHKNIPVGAGLGGGSSNAVATLKAVNELFELNLAPEDLKRYASKLGADCAFFVDNRPAIAKGIGDELVEITLDLTPFHLLLVKPSIHISTAEAYKGVKPTFPSVHLAQIINNPVGDWRGLLVNDFEESCFSAHPELAAIKEKLYELGAVYAAMSGSGSTIFGLFEQPVQPEKLDELNAIFKSKTFQLDLRQTSP